MSLSAAEDIVLDSSLAPAPAPEEPGSSHATLPTRNQTVLTDKGAVVSLKSKSPSQLSSREARQHAEQEGCTLPIVAFSLSVFLTILTPTALLLILIFIFNAYQADGLAIDTTADLQNLLTVSQVITTVVSKSVSVVVAVHAYQLAAQWLKSSNERAGGRPTPLQLGLLLSVLQGSNIVAWVKVRWHLLRSSTRDRLLLQPSPILKRAITSLGFLLLLSNAISGLDTWLHVSSKAIPVARRSPYRGASLPMYGKRLNETQCEEGMKSTASFRDTCLMRFGGSYTFSGSRPEGVQTLTNTSAKNSAIMTDDGLLALMVPASVQSNLVYEATTTGIGSTCMSLTKQCLKPVASDGRTIYGGYMPFLNCTEAVPSANITINSTVVPYTYQTLPFALIYASNGSFVDADGYPIFRIYTNPFNIAALIRSVAFDLQNGEVDYFVNNTGFFRHDYTGSWNVVYCNITVFDVKYRYVPSANELGGSYTSLSVTPANIRMTWLVSIGFGMNIIQQYMPSRIEGVGIRAGDYVATFAQHLSREMLALSAALYEPAPVSEVSELTFSLGSRVQLMPLSLYLFAVMLYAFTALFIGVAALIESHAVKFVKLVQLRITTAFPIVHALFGPVEYSRTWKSDGIEMYSAETENDRLYVGPVKSEVEGDSFGFARA